MTTRQKKAWGAGLSGVMAIVALFVTNATGEPPTWLQAILAAIGTVAPMFGIKISKPEIE